jgi:phosphatidate cytidylyltransferase
MVYKNLFYRLLFSLLFFTVYFIAFNNKYLLFGLGTFIYLLTFYEIFKFFKNFLIIILFYLFLSYLCFTLYIFNYFDNFIFNLFIFTIIFFDSFSYFAGAILGKNYLFKYLSPKKTLEGYIGGFFFTNICLFIYLFLIKETFEIISLVMLVNLIILIAIIGDLIESYFKRKNSIKDSSNYLPGHGGYFDRFDSFIASIIFLTLFSLFNI